MKFSPVMPALRYKNADRAIQFLITGLGFTQHARYDGPNGSVLHAELTRGNGMVMIGTDPGDGKAADGVQMDLGHSGIYLMVETDAEVDHGYAAALRAGAARSLDLSHSVQYRYLTQRSYR